MTVTVTMKTRTAAFTGALLLLLLLLLEAVGLAASQCLTVDDSRPATSRGTHQALYTGQQAFSLDLLARMDAHAGRDNVFFSPYSTYHALLLAYFLSAGPTERSLKSALRFSRQDKVDVMQAYKFDKLRRTMAAGADAPYEFSAANRVFASTDVSVRECMADILGDELRSLDFKADPAAALGTINSWVERQTHGMIRDLLPPDALDANTNLVLVNAAYFRGLWEYQFPAHNTDKMLFYATPSENTIVDMMMQEGTFNHDVSEKLECHILELPYKGSTASMYIFLPPFTKENGLANVLSKLNAQTFAEIVSDGGLVPRKVQVSLPKFSLEQTVELTPMLESLGVGDLFANSADLSTLTGVKNVTLGRAIHKAKIEVTEEGTKAAAATALFTFRSSRPVEPAQFNCNHPFVYIIYDKQNQAILFVGIYRKP